MPLAGCLEQRLLCMEGVPSMAIAGSTFLTGSVQLAISISPYHNCKREQLLSASLQVKKRRHREVSSLPKVTEL